MPNTVNFIGCGKLGTTIAKLMVDSGAAKIDGICNQGYSSAKKAIAYIGQGKVCATISDLPPADITFITTPDDYVQSCAEQLACCADLKANSLIIHCSGLLPASILNACKQQGCFIYSVHPMLSFSSPEISTREYPGTYCAIEGCEQHLNTVHQLFKSIGSITYSLNPQKKASYHAAARAGF